MAFSWGATALKVIPGSYSPPHVNSNLVLIDLIPGTDGAAKPIIQQGGYDRAKAGFDSFVTSYTDYSSLLADYKAATERTYADGTYSGTMIISYLSEAIEEVPGRKWTYSIQFMEV